MLVHAFYRAPWTFECVEVAVVTKPFEVRWFVCGMYK
jgi:hypothetical protein